MKKYAKNYDQIEINCKGHKKFLFKKCERAHPYRINVGDLFDKGMLSFAKQIKILTSIYYNINR